MQNLTEHIASIEDKVRLVLQKMEELKAENIVLKKKNDNLLSRIEELNGKKELEQTNLSTNQQSEGKYEEIKKELDHYIDEIDQTIQLLKAS